jgi:hypothetical protein
MARGATHLHQQRLIIFIALIIAYILHTSPLAMRLQCDFTFSSFVHALINKHISQEYSDFKPPIKNSVRKTFNRIFIRE